MEIIPILRIIIIIGGKVQLLRYHHNPSASHEQSADPEVAYALMLVVTKALFKSRKQGPLTCKSRTDEKYNDEAQSVQE